MLHFGCDKIGVAGDGYIEISCSVVSLVGGVTKSVFRRLSGVCCWSLSLDLFAEDEDVVYQQRMLILSLPFGKMTPSFCQRRQKYR